MPLTEGWELNNTTNILGGVCFPCGLSGFDEASSFLYRFVTDVAGELRIDWSWVKSGTTTFGLLGPILLLNGTHIRTADNPSGFVIRQLAANTEYGNLLRFAIQLLRRGGLGRRRNHDHPALRDPGVGGAHSRALGTALRRFSVSRRRRARSATRSAPTRTGPTRSNAGHDDRGRHSCECRRFSGTPDVGYRVSEKGGMSP